jgi:hypothetical protein
MKTENDESRASAEGGSAESVQLRRKSRELRKAAAELRRRAAAAVEKSRIRTKLRSERYSAYGLATPRT